MEQLTYENNPQFSSGTSQVKIQNPTGVCITPDIIQIYNLLWEISLANKFLLFELLIWRQRKRKTIKKAGNNYRSFTCCFVLCLINAFCSIMRYLFISWPVAAGLSWDMAYAAHSSPSCQWLQSNQIKGQYLGNLGRVSFWQGSSASPSCL